jgi:hypothetical protein
MTMERFSTHNADIQRPNSSSSPALYTDRFEIRPRHLNDQLGGTFLANWPSCFLNARLAEGTPTIGSIEWRVLPPLFAHFSPFAPSLGTVVGGEIFSGGRGTVFPKWRK